MNTSMLTDPDRFTEHPGFALSQKLGAINGPTAELIFQQFYESTRWKTFVLEGDLLRRLNNTAPDIYLLWRALEHRIEEAARPEDTIVLQQAVDILSSALEHPNTLGCQVANYLLPAITQVLEPKRTLSDQEPPTPQVVLPAMTVQKQLPGHPLPKRLPLSTTETNPDGTLNTEYFKKTVAELGRIKQQQRGDLGK